MRRIEEFAGNTLNWIQPRPMARQFELRQDGDVLATLRFDTAFGSLARAETEDGVFTFKRVGFFRPGVTIRKAGSDEDLGNYQPSWNNGGELELENGKGYTFRCTSFWHGRWSMLDESGDTVLTFALKGVVKTGATVAFGKRCEDAPLLALFGGYLMVLMAEDAAVRTKTPDLAAS